MVVTIKVQNELASQLRNAGREVNSAAKTLLDLAREFHTVVSPMHPTINHPSLNGFFVAEINSPVSAQEFASQALDVTGVESAYVKSPDYPAAPH
jgi:hypothetical protein